MRAPWAVLIAAAFIPPLHAAELYKWSDPATGAPVYSSDPPAADIKSVEAKRVSPSTIETSNLPYGVQRAVSRNPIVLYVSDCGEFCKAARAYLAKRGLPHSERNPEEPAVAAELKKVTGGALEVPYLKVGTKSVRGYDEARYAAALDAAGYPRASLAGLTAKPVQPKKSRSAEKPADPAVAESTSAGASKSSDAAGSAMVGRLASIDSALAR
ncbi:MAG: glutaredoxin family protein [Burkholderiales bacterium]